ncbi:hypothetical protein ACN28S_50105 [Cystobacter fuscus]
MRALLWAWALTVSLGAAPAPAQTLLRIEERDLDGASHAVGPGVAIVDISSTLNIGVERAALLERIRASAPGTSSQELIQDLLQLQSFLNEGAGRASNPWRTRCRSGPGRGTPAANAKLQGAYRQWGKSALQVMEYANRSLSGGDPRRARLRESLNVALERNAGASIEQLYATITQVGTQEALRLRGELDEVLREEGVSVQMGVWVTTRGEGSRPIHLPNFDTYAPQGRVDIERFKILLTEEQKAQLRRPINSRATSSRAASPGRSGPRRASGSPSSSPARAGVSSRCASSWTPSCGGRIPPPSGSGRRRRPPGSSSSPMAPSWMGSRRSTARPPARPPRRTSSSAPTRIWTRRRGAPARASSSSPCSSPRSTPRRWAWTRWASGCSSSSPSAVRPSPPTWAPCSRR